MESMTNIEKIKAALSFSIEEINNQIMYYVEYGGKEDMVSYYQSAKKEAEEALASLDRGNI